MDKDKERSEHFKGFAQLLWDELKEFDPYDFDLTAKDSWQILHSGEGFDPSILEEYIKQIIAQCAYDLVYHLLDKTMSGTFNVGFGTPGEIREVIEQLPDLTAWPTPPTPSPAPTSD